MVLSPEIKDDIPSGSRNRLNELARELTIGQITTIEQMQKEEMEALEHAFESLEKAEDSIQETIDNIDMVNSDVSERINSLMVGAVTNLRQSLNKISTLKDAVDERRDEMSS